MVANHRVHRTRPVSHAPIGRGLRTTGVILRRTATLALLGLAGILLAAPAPASIPAAAPAAAPALATAALPSPLRGQDISWPQCPKGTAQPKKVRLRWPLQGHQPEHPAAQRRLVGRGGQPHPDAGRRADRPGHLDGRRGLPVAAVVDGVLAAYRAGGTEVGVYATRSHWNDLVGAVKYGMAKWHMTGPASLTTASKACTAGSFNGGPTFLAQWWTTTRDYDVMCPDFARSTR